MRRQRNLLITQQKKRREYMNKRCTWAHHILADISTPTNPNERANKTKTNKNSMNVRRKNMVYQIRKERKKPIHWVE